MLEHGGIVFLNRSTTPNYLAITKKGIFQHSKRLWFHIKMDTLKLVLLAAVLATIVHAEVSYTIGADETHSEETGIQNQRLIASNGQFPWHATIFVSKEPNKWTSGSGALVTPRIVLTTATNLLLARQVRIYLGSNEFGRGVSVASEISVVHPRFLPTRNPEFDVGIILLKTSITVSNLIQPIRIATENIQLEGQWLRISGFAPNCK